MLAFVMLALAVAMPQPPATPMPPAGSEPVVRVIEIAFPTQGNVSVVDPQTYLYYIHTRPSQPSAGVWQPYDKETALADFKRLWDTAFLDNIWIEVTDEPYDNGVIGKHITFNLEERPRVKIIAYDGSKVLEASKIEEQLKDANLQIRADSFLDLGIVHKAESTIREMLQEKGYQSATVSHRIVDIAGGTKLVRLTFHLEDGPRVRIRSIDFAGNKAISDRTLAGLMKNNRLQPWFLPKFVFSEKGVYLQTKFEEDADRITAFYRDRGFIGVQVGTPEIVPLADSRDHKTRWARLRVPVSEGPRYAVGAFEFDGNAVVKSENLRPFFPLAIGDSYAENAIRKGLEKAREAYGVGGYYEFTGYPDLKPHEPKALTATRSKNTRALHKPWHGDSRRLASMLLQQGLRVWPWYTYLKRPTEVVDVTMRMQEGKQYFINRITFSGNTVTRDAVIRRELALYEGGVFNTEALKYSIKRLNQLGYFKPIEDQKTVKVEKLDNEQAKVDLNVKVEEQNRNSVNFGAGVSEYDGIFGSFSYTAANFLGRGESVTMALQRGSRSNMYQMSVSEPYLFDRPISGSVDVYSRKIDYYTSASTVGYSEVREGTTLTMGRPFMRFGRLFMAYTYELTDIAISSDLLSTGSSTTSNTTEWSGMPSFNSYLDQGRHKDSRIQPSYVYNTVDNPMMPHKGTRLTTSVAVAGTWLGGSYNYVKPDAEAVMYIPTSKRTGFGLRAQAGWLRTYSSTKQLPYYLRYFLGGEYQIRGVDIRTVGPMDSKSRALGGNKFVLFNAEYYFDVAGPVRLLLFHDAGQAFGETQKVDFRQLRTSSGAEARVIMPMLNVPFRFIWAYNRYRDSFQPEFTFKFGVGATF